MEAEVEEYLRRRYEDLIATVVRVSKEDLRMVQSSFTQLHVLTFSLIICWDTDGLFCSYSFRTYRICWWCDGLFFPSQMPIAGKWTPWMPTLKSFSMLPLMTGLMSRSSFQFDDDIEDSAGSRPILDAIEHIIDAREWDVPYHIRVAIDKGILPPRNCPR